jgi:predicted small metal-binding protein
VILSPTAPDKRKLMAKVRFAVDMIGNLRDFSRVRTPGWPPAIRHESEVTDAYTPPDDDAKRRTRGYWGRHRSDVVQAESENDSRLGTLCWARDVLLETEGDKSKPLVAEIERHMRANFDVSPSEIPDDMVERIKWIRRSIRDYRALPKNLRQL